MKKEFVYKLKPLFMRHMDKIIKKWAHCETPAVFFMGADLTMKSLFLILEHHSMISSEISDKMKETINNLHDLIVIIWSSLPDEMRTRYTRDGIFEKIGIEEEEE